LKSPSDRELATPAEFRPSVRAVVAAIAAVAAVYVYFLIFAQFGLLQGLLDSAAASETRLKLVLTLMGVCGIGSSAVTAWCFRADRARAWLAGSFAVAGVAAGVAARAEAFGMFGAAAALTGLGIGGATVTLAAVIRRVIGTKHLGLALGVGTGLAYGFCNLPPVFQAGPTTQAGLAVGAALMGMMAAAGLELRDTGETVDAPDYQSRGLTIWVTVFLALVWLDSAAFYVIQHNPALQGGTWQGAGRLCANAALHFGAAVLAGWALDRGNLRGVVLVAMGLLVAACLLLAAAAPRPGVVASLYVAGVSLYSTALVFYPGRSGRPCVAALVYAVAGWAGSAFGIGLVEHSQAVPGWLPVGAGLVTLAAVALRRK
jgi:hypothetical protein